MVNFILILFGILIIPTKSSIEKAEVYVLDSVSTSISKPLFISINSSLTIICHKMLDVWFPNQIWRTINIHISCSQRIDNLFILFIGENVTDVDYQYHEFRRSSSLNFIWNTIAPDSLTDIFFNFLNRKNVSERIIQIPLYENRCIGVIEQPNMNIFPANSQANRQISIELNVYPIDKRKMLCFIFGILLFIMAKPLSKNIFFYYLTGIFFGLILSLFIAIYFLAKLIPFKKYGHYALILSGYSLVGMVLNYLTINYISLIYDYSLYIILYFIITSTIAFAYLYYKGPIRNLKCLNMIRWALNIIGIVIAIQFGSTIPYSKYMSTCLIAGIPVFCFKIYTKALAPISLKFYSILVKWQMLDPVPRKLLTTNEYSEVGYKTTEIELKKMRKYCCSRECNQWELMKRLNHKEEFISFMEGAHHVPYSERTIYDDTTNFSFGDINNGKEYI